MWLLFHGVTTGVIGNWCHRSYHGAAKKNPNSPPNPRSFKALIASRPTVIDGAMHSVSMSIMTVTVLIAYYMNSDNDNPWIYQGIHLITIWQTIGLPMSLSYFVADCYFYCLPRKDVVIFVHHCLMIFGLYPLGHESGALLAGAGDAEWAIWLCIVMYTSELSTAIMNYRWYLVNTLEENWIGFAIVNGFAMLSWTFRAILFPYLLIVKIFPRFHLYTNQQQLFTFAALVFGCAVMGLLLVHWLFVMCRGGLKSMLVFKKSPQRMLNLNNGGYSFADDVSGKENRKD